MDSEVKVFPKPQWYSYFSGRGLGGKISFLGGMGGIRERGLEGGGERRGDE